VPGRVSFANSITLTPGTISLDVLEKEIEVHALTTESATDLESGEMGKRVEHLESG
jgi:multicomponent Na+:H+ antiporter subunit E